MYTTPFGKLYEPYMDVPDDEPQLPICTGCGRTILENEDCYWLSDDEVYCSECESEAIEAIGLKHIDEYKAVCEL